MVKQLASLDLWSQCDLFSVGSTQQQKEKALYNILTHVRVNVNVYLARQKGGTSKH